MKKQIESLVKRQAIEIEIRSIKSELNEVSNRLEALDARITDRKEALLNQETLLATLQKEYRDFERDTQTMASRIQKDQERLGMVKTNKEYTSLLKEIEELEAVQSGIEDKMIQYLDKIDDGEKKNEEEKGLLLTLEKDIERERNEILKESEANQKKLDFLEEQLKGVSQEVSSELIDTFTKVQSRVGHIGIAPVRDAVCQGCHMNMPPQMFNELQRCDSLKFCPHCHRIVYWQEGASVNEERSE